MIIIIIDISLSVTYIRDPDKLLRTKGYTTFGYKISVTRQKCYGRKMLQAPNVTGTKCYWHKMLLLKNVTPANCCQYKPNIKGARNGL